VNGFLLEGARFVMLSPRGGDGSFTITTELVMLIVGRPLVRAIRRLRNEHLAPLPLPLGRCARAITAGA
jgi:hypothetical protein